ncbi:hypothetical protein [Microbulbifer magnicolonia]|uniref:hypothetical protein n=1 Tax=Microbulbifer magnicolonia TaxID=3109744 RepID=UPI002B40DECA|nr:hypothetical protein [Microbulbifer sp. GG15]
MTNTESWNSYRTLRGIVAVWFLCASVSSAAQTESPERGWYPDPLGSIGYPEIAGLDLNEKPAGTRGFLRAQGESLVFEDGTPARFWGTNMQAYALFSSSEQDIRQHARRLAGLGFNLVRIHHHDSKWVEPNIFAAPEDNTLRLNDKALRQLDLWIKCLRDEGIYIWLDLHVGRAFTSRDGIRGFADAAKGKDRARLKGFNYYNRDILQAMRDFNRQYLSHKNHYTGIEYRNDPAIIAALITNENDLTYHFGNALLGDKGVPQHHKAFIRSVSAATEQLGLNEKRAAKTWEMGDSKIFLNHQEYQFNNFMIADLRRLGFKAPIATTNSWGGMGLVSLPALSVGDLIDVHSYGDDGDLGRNPRESPGLLHWIGSAQVSGKPLAVSEWNLRDFPAGSRHQLPMMLAGVASLQGWDALMLYGYAQVPLHSESIGNNWSSFKDPEMMALMPAASLLYRQQHVAGAKRHYRLRVPEKQFFKQVINAESAISIRTLIEQSKLTIDLPYSATLPWLAHPETASEVPNEDRESDGATEIITDVDRDYLPAGQNYVRSDTGELLRDWQRGLHIIDTGKSVVVSGNLGNNRNLQVGIVKFDIRNDSATIAVQSLDNRPLTQSERILITAVARSRVPENKGEKYINEKVDGTIEISASGNYSFTPLSVTKQQEIRLRGDGTALKIALPGPSPTPWMLLVKSP